MRAYHCLVSLFVSFAVVDHVASWTTQRSFARRSALSMNVENMPTKENVRVGVIGMGRIGLVHLEAINKAPGVIPVIVSNPTISKAENGKDTARVLSSEHGSRVRARVLQRRYHMLCWEECS